MSKNHKITKYPIKNILPSPFVIAVLLTFLVMIFGIFTMGSTNYFQNFGKVLSFWEQGIWNQDLLVFAYQMMLILVLGHILVLSHPVERLLDFLTSFINSTATAVVVVSISTMLVSFFNWGLGLIFGAILVRKIGESSSKRNFKLNYPLLGASGYIGLMVWHGGLSGSAPLKVAEKGHISSISNLVSPDFIATSETVLSMENIIIFALLLVLMPLLFLWLSKLNKVKEKAFSVDKLVNIITTQKYNSNLFEQKKLPGIFFGLLILITFFIQYWSVLISYRLTPNMLNFLMLGLSFLFHGSISQFLDALQTSVSDVSGILIQFPLYFGMMGIMRDSGLGIQIAEFFISISNQSTLPVFSFISSGILNLFVPSGGGQWAIQGPIILESATALKVPLPKMIMAMAYGDQITNMLQPFWAIPLLAITKLKAHEILPYTLWMFGLGSVVFMLGLLFIFV